MPKPIADALTQKPWWNEFLASLKSTPLNKLARKYGVSVADLHRALEAQGLLPGATPVAAPRAAASAPAANASAARARGTVSSRGGATARLEALRHRLGKEADGVIAAELGIARKTVVEFRKRHGISAYIPPRPRETPSAAPAVAEATPAAPAVAEAPPVAVTEAPASRPAAAPRRRAAKMPEVPIVGRPSKVDPYRDLVGVLPDREVAERAGVTAENVRMYRIRRGIVAQWREASAAASPAARAPVAAPAAAPVAAAPQPAEAAVPRRRGRLPAPPGGSMVEQALAPFRDQIGKVTDAVIATRAGISRSAVSAYRSRHGIAAAGRASGSRAEPAPAAVASPVTPEVEPAPAPAAESAPAAAATPVMSEAVPAPPARQHVYLVQARGEGVERTFGLVADGPVEAARRAVAWLESAGLTLVKLKLVADAIG